MSNFAVGDKVEILSLPSFCDAYQWLLGTTATIVEVDPDCCGMALYRCHHLWFAEYRLRKIEPAAQAERGPHDKVSEGNQPGPQLGSQENEGMGFRVGDRVEVVDAPSLSNKTRVGHIGTIDQVSRFEHPSSPYRLVIGRKGIWFSERELRASPVAARTAASLRPAARPQPKPVAQATAQATAHCACSNVEQAPPKPVELPNFGRTDQVQGYRPTMSKNPLCNLVSPQTVDAIRDNAKDAALRTAVSMLTDNAANAVGALSGGLGDNGKVVGAFIKTPEGKAALAASLGVLQLVLPQLQGCKMQVLGDELRTQSIQYLTNILGDKLQGLVDLFTSAANAIDAA